MSVSKMRVNMLSANAKASFEIVASPTDLVKDVKARICAHRSIAFPENTLELRGPSGAALPDAVTLSAALDAKTLEECALELRIAASPETVAQQLVAMFEGHPQGTSLSTDELGLLYCYRHGVSANQALRTVGSELRLPEFIAARPEFRLDADGKVALVRTNAPLVDSPSSGDSTARDPEASAPHKAAVTLPSKPANTAASKAKAAPRAPLSAAVATAWGVPRQQEPGGSPVLTSQPAGPLSVFPSIWSGRRDSQHTQDTTATHRDSASLDDPWAGLALGAACPSAIGLEGELEMSLGGADDRAEPSFGHGSLEGLASTLKMIDIMSPDASALQSPLLRPAHTRGAAPAYQPTPLAALSHGLCGPPPGFSAQAPAPLDAPPGLSHGYRAPSAADLDDDWRRPRSTPTNGMGAFVDGQFVGPSGKGGLLETPSLPPASPQPLPRAPHAPAPRVQPPPPSVPPKAPAVPQPPAASGSVTNPAVLNQMYLDLHQTISSRAFNSRVSQVLIAVQGAVQERLGLNVVDVVRGGAVGKGTAVQGNEEASLVFFVEGLPTTKHAKWLPALLKSSAVLLRLALVPQALQEVVVEADTHITVKAKHNLTVTVHFAAAGKNWGENVRALGKARPDFRKFLEAPLQKEQTALISRQSGAVKVTIRLLKWWREQQAWSTELAKPSDYMLELMAIYTHQQTKPANQHAAVSNVLSLLARFEDVRIIWTNFYKKTDVWAPLLLQRPLLMDPVSPYSNVADPMVFDPTELMQFAQNTHFFW